MLEILYMYNEIILFNCDASKQGFQYGSLPFRAETELLSITRVRTTSIQFGWLHKFPIEYNTAFVKSNQEYRLLCLIFSSKILASAKNLDRGRATPRHDWGGSTVVIPKW